MIFAVAIVLLAIGGHLSAESIPIKFNTAREGTVLINIYGPDGTLVRRVVQGQHFTKGAHTEKWDGLRDDGKPVGAGDYTWRGLFHEGIGLKLRGWVANGSGVPWETPDGKGGWGGDAGVPSAVAADDKRVYLGWSLAREGKSVVACDPEGGVAWRHRREERAGEASGCKALAVDDGVVYVLGGYGDDAAGGAIYKLNAKDGQPVPWPGGALDLKITSLWPKDGSDKPGKADAMAVRHGRIYLSFTSDQFLAVIEAKDGAYVQTVVGAPPGMIDVAPTQTELPDKPGKLSDADFAVVSLGGGVLGRILFAHDPFWVLTSDLTPVERDVSITALSVIGDGAKFHRDTAFVGFGNPIHQVQARLLLDAENPSWVAGRMGGRPLLGPWQADGLRAIRSVAIAPDGKLWVAEGDAYPKRFSVWDTTGKEGKLVREYFGPADRAVGGGAINPLDPDLMFAQGCEWRIDRKTGQAKCLGVVTREPVSSAQYGVGENGHAYLILNYSPLGGSFVNIFERLAEGQYKLRSRIYWADENGAEVEFGPFAGERRPETQTIFWADENGDGLEQPNERRSVPYVLQQIWDVTQDLTLGVLQPGNQTQFWLLKVQGWSSCDAPRFDFGSAVRLPHQYASQPSADERFVLTASGWSRDHKGSRVYILQDYPSLRELWALPMPAAKPSSNEDNLIGSALLPGAVKNVWFAVSEEGVWRLLTEDGFDLGGLFESDPRKARWPKVAVPGADMAHVATPSHARITQAVDGKIYVQAGASAWWNMEVTGLDKVKALTGGTVTVPAAK